MCINNPKKDTESSRSGYCIELAFVIVVSLWGLSWWGISNFIEEPTNQGTFGDMFGAVNALFSGLAFAGLIATLLYQKNELKLQREELKLTREELQGQRKEFEEQNKTMKRQRFENTFFNMLSLQQEIVANLSYEYYVNPNICPPNVPAEQFYYNSPKGLLHGREVFEGMYKRAIIDYNGRRYADGLYNIFKNFGHLAYSNIKATTRFDHCFRHLYRIYKYVDTSDLITKEERYDYACIIRSQLSDYELVMLFYNCLTTNGREKFKPLIEKYAIFNNLREELLANAAHKELYAETAYDRCAE
jgi:hypothetical protein